MWSPHGKGLTISKIKDGYNIVSHHPANQSMAPLAAGFTMAPPFSPSSIYNTTKKSLSSHG